MTNIQFVADQVLEQKEFKKTSEKPDLLISIENEYDISTYSRAISSRSCP